MNGGFTGKVGSIIGYQLNGKWVIKGLPRPSKKNKKGTADQKKCRQRFSLMQGFLSSVLYFVRVGFNLEGKLKMISAHNAAKSYNMLHAFDNDGQIIYSNIRLTQGSLQGAEETTVATNESGLQFIWNNQLSNGLQKTTDQVMLLVYQEETNEAYFILSGARRQDGTDLLKIPYIEKGKTFHTWISFIADDRKSISNSVYAGLIIF
ncbi:DUF6266 family protein [Pedobacter mucosus]|uniref:DUF6266 family protein n=1 Tax=Pedobacter mucosus TaxID=2895286 RepID=UPI001EE4A3EF|nr:DUF6266 family protein [Pedobacter mucosus]UKT62794.1 DUF6266 family protein [Pedobacter mucosus]